MVWSTLNQNMRDLMKRWQSVESQKNGPTEETESSDGDDKTIDCNQDNSVVLREDNAFSGGAEEHQSY